MNLPWCTILCFLGLGKFGGAAPIVDEDKPAELPPAPLARKSAPAMPVITEHPKGFLAEDENEIARLYCKASGNPPPTITWLKDGQPLGRGSGLGIIFLAAGDIMIQQLRNKPPGANTGIYQCLATNDVGTAHSNNASIQLAYIRNNFRVSPINEAANVNDQVALQCQPPKGFPDPSVMWKKDNHVVTLNRRVQLLNHNLVITRAVKGDAGTYTCVASNPAGFVESEPATLNIYDPPHFQVEPVDQTTRVGRSVTLECRATGDPKPKITWSRSQGEIPFERSKQTNRGNLQIEDVLYSDQGKYTCSATNRAGTVSTDAYLTVQGIPEFTEVSVNAEEEIGSTATLNCRATGNPQPAIAWLDLRGREIFPEQTSSLNNILVFSTGDLVIYNVNFRDDGIYRCKAINSVGIVYTDVRLKIKPRMSTIPPPVIRRGPQNATCRVGGTVTFTCTSDATPRPDILWYKDGVLIENAGNLMATAGQLRVTSAVNDDAGRYTCKVMNDYGMSSWDAWLRVVGSGRSIPKQPDNEDLPSAPGRPKLVNSTSTTVAIRWQASAHPGSAPILHYDIDFYNVGSQVTSWERLSKVKGTVGVVKNLTPTSDYVFLVRAVNAKGFSKPSPISQGIKTQNIRATRPQTPEDVQQILDHFEVRLTQVVEFHQASEPTGSIRLMWEAESPCDKVDNFEIAWQPLTGSDDRILTEVVSCSESSYDLADLKTGVTYQVKIRPVRNSIKGRGSPLEFVSFGKGNTAPIPPVISPKQKDDNSVTLYWKSPSGVDENRIAGYSVRCRSTDGSFVKIMNVSGSQSAITLKNLPHGGALMLSVSYSTLLGEGSTSRESKVTIGGTGTTTTETPEGFVEMLQQQPAIIAGFVVGVVILVAAVVGGIWYYKRSKRDRKARGLHVRSFSFTPASGPHRVSAHRYDGSYPFTNAFQIAPTQSGGVGNSGGSGGMGGGSDPSVGLLGNPGGVGNSRVFMQAPTEGRMHGGSNVTKNAVVTYDVKNDAVSNQLDEKPLGVSHPSFSYVTDQLTSMCDIPPQFSKTNLSRPSIASTQSCPAQQQMQQHHQQLMRNRSGNSNVFTSSDHEPRFHDTSSSSASNIRGMGDLPPPPPSPPLSQRTAISDRSRGSSGAMHSTGERSGRGQRSRRRPQGGSSGAVTASYATTQFTNADTDTGIDSPHQTPSPHRPVTISSPVPPTPPARGASVFPYERGQPVMQFNANQDPTLNLGYLAGPSEGETDGENDHVGLLRTRQFINDPNHRNSVAVSAVSMMNTYGSASDQDENSSDVESVVSSDDESLLMESVSQVGQNRNHAEDERHNAARPNPQPRHFMTPQHQQSLQQQKHFDNRAYPNTYHRHPGPSLEEDAPLIQDHKDAPLTKPRSGRRVGNKSRRQRASNKDLSRLNSASSSTSSSYQHNTGDSGMSAGVGCSTEHSSLNSNASAGSGNAGAVSRSRTAGNLSSFDSPVATEHHVTSEEELTQRSLPPDGNYSSAVSPTASCVSEQSGYHSTGSSCWQYHEPHKASAAAPRRVIRNDASPDSVPMTQHNSTHSLGDRNSGFPKPSQRFYPNTINASAPAMQECTLAPTTDGSGVTRDAPQFQLARTVLVGGIVGKAARGRPQELSDVPEVSTSDFCEDYSDQSQ